MTFVGGERGNELPPADASTVCHRCVAYFRGFPELASLVMILVQNMKDARAFLALMATLLYFTALMFLALFRAPGGDDDAAIDDDTVAGFTGGAAGAADGGLASALVTTFDIAILGAFSPGAFDSSVAPILARLLFVGVMVIVTVSFLLGVIVVAPAAAEGDSMMWIYGNVTTICSMARLLRDETRRSCFLVPVR